MQQLVQCFKCGEKNNLGNRFCIRCGEPFHYKCPQCRATISTDYKACPNCGVALDWGIKIEQDNEIGFTSDMPGSLEMSRGNLKKKRSSSFFRRNRATPWLIGFVIIVLCITAAFAIDSFWLGKLSQSTKQSTPAGKVEIARELTAEELSRDYAIDEIAADKLYKGNVLKVTGKVSSINKNIMGTSFVKLSGGSIENWEIQCTFDKQYSDEIAEIELHDVITILGTCDGYFMSVKMKNCMLIH